MSFRYFSAFSGIGGFDQGIRLAFPNAVCTGFSEVDRYAIKVYEKHFPNRINYGDIRNIDAKSLPDFDIFCGGFPCQDLSLAGKRAGLQGNRSGLFYEIIRIIREKQPYLVFLENVKGLFSSDGGRDFARILIELDDAGYSVEWQCLNSKDFGVPQNRERVFIIGHSRTKPGKQIFPLGCESGVHETEQQSPQRQRINRIDFSNERVQKGNENQSCTRIVQFQDECFGVDGFGGVLIDEDVGSLILAPNNFGHKAGDGTATRKHTLTDTVPSLQACCGNTQQSYVVTPTYPVQIGQGKDSRAMRAGTCIGNQDEAFTVRSCNPNGVMQRNKIRRLMPVECERLQGYPSGWTAVDSDGVPISDSQRYKMLGNAVTVNVIQAIASRFSISHKLMGVFN